MIEGKKSFFALYFSMDLVDDMIEVQQRKEENIKF